jgi:hypothetical protein
MIVCGGSLESVTGEAARLERVRKRDVRSGDWLVVQTGNSTYTLRAQRDGTFLVSGGWFDAKAVSPMRLRVNGCTWGGCMIKVDVVAALGLRMEFANRVTTSPIRRIILLRHELQN